MAPAAKAAKKPGKQPLKGKGKVVKKLGKKKDSVSKKSGGDSNRLEKQVK